MPMNNRLLRPLATSRFASLRVGLVAYWPLNEDAESGDVTAVDWTGRGNDLTSNNSVLSTLGKIGNARQFAAVNSEFLSIASNADVQFGESAWTIALWFYVPSAATGQMALFGKDIAGGREFECSYNRVANTLEVVPYDSDGIGINLSIGSVSRDEWHFLCVRHEDASPTFYAHLDGIEYSASRGEGVTFNTTSTEFRVGARIYSGFFNYLTGNIDEVAKWSRSLSAEEVAALYNNGNGIDLRK